MTSHTISNASMKFEMSVNKHVAISSDQLIIIANYTNFPGTSIKFQDISSISSSCRHPVITARTNTEPE